MTDELKKELKEEELKNVAGGYNPNRDYMKCPRCGEPIYVSKEQIIENRSLICLHCGLRLVVPGSKSKIALEEIRKISGK